MCKVQMLRALVEQRLTAAAEEIFGLFERTIAEYEEELCRSKEENERQRELLDAVFNPQLRVHRADVQQMLVVKEEVPPEQHIKVEQEEPWSSQEGEQLQGLEEADITKFPFTPVPVKSEDDKEEDMQQLLVVKEEVPPKQQECSSSVDQDDPEPPPHIKEEQEELWSRQEGEQLQGLEEADITKFPFTLVPVKSEDDEEEAQSSQLHQRQTKTNTWKQKNYVEDCDGPEPARNSHPFLQPETEDQTGDSSDPETDDSAHWKETREPQSALNSLKHDSRCKKPFSCSECGKRFGFKNTLKRHMRTHTGEKPFSCSECGRRFGRMTHLKTHMITHTGEKPFSCSECDKSFSDSHHLKRHMMTHTGEKPFSCSVCKKSFTQSGYIQKHMRTHTGEKPFSCSVCGKALTDRGTLKNHMMTHTGEKPFSCSVCKKSFTLRGDLRSHMRTHTGEKPFSCSVCKKSFKQSGYLRSHMVVHTGEKRFSCSVCNKRFAWHSHVKRHKCVGQMETEADGEDCGGPEPARNSHPLLQPETEDETRDSSEPETGDME